MWFPAAAVGAAARGRQYVGMAGGAIGASFVRAASPQAGPSAMGQRSPLGIADIADGKMIKALRSVLNDAPMMTGGIGAAQNEAKNKNGSIAPLARCLMQRTTS